METKEDDVNKEAKKARKRTKRLFSSIKDQIEFYFSDSNLYRDKFLWNVIEQSEDGYIELDTFKNFNKIKALSTDCAVIAKALNQSSLLEVSEDELKVRRKTPIAEPVGLDERTVYIEHIPTSADNEWVRKIFSAYGPINYVSLPKFKHSGNLKGFAFIEFNEVNSAIKACEHFGAKCEDLKDYVKSLEGNDISQDKSAEENAKDKVVEEDKSEIKDDVTIKLEKKDDDADGNKMTPSKKKRHRKRKKKSIDDEELNTISLRVMSKLEWKCWRKKYLALQKMALAEIKKSLFLIKTNEHTNVPDPVNTVKYEDEKVVQKLDRISFIPNVILRVKLKNPVDDVKKFKNEVKTVADISFIDVGFDCNINIRCPDSASAEKLNNNYTKIPGCLEAFLLSGEEEKKYWEKIIEDQANKHQNKKGKTRKRDYQKVVAKIERAAKHIRFDNIGNESGMKYTDPVVE